MKKHFAIIDFFFLSGKFYNLLLKLCAVYWIPIYSIMEISLVIFKTEVIELERKSFVI